MMLCTFPGRHGDLLWALPTLRALHDSGFGPVDLKIAGEFAGLVDLLERQPYLGHVYADPRWGMSQGWQPPVGDDWISPYEKVLHLGYQRWPERVLPEEPYLQAVKQLGHVIEPLDLKTPWINVPPTVNGGLHGWDPLVVGFTEAWFELKYGIVCCLNKVDIPGLPRGHILAPVGSRWETEADYEGSSWSQAAEAIKHATLFLGDCSALHVLAVAIGTPVVLVEPMEARHNPIFYPVGMHGPQVTMVIGLDGQPTFDARHTAETLKEVLCGR
jgi:hypothetical protein